MKQGNCLITPAVSNIGPMTANKNGETVAFIEMVTTPKQVNPVVNAVDLASIGAVLDTICGRLQLLTVFPDNEGVECHAAWSLPSELAVHSVAELCRPCTANSNWRPRDIF